MCKAFITVIRCLRHKAVVANMASLDVDLLQLSEGFFKILESMKVVLIITCELIDILARFFNRTQEILSVLIEGC